MWIFHACLEALVATVGARYQIALWPGEHIDHETHRLRKKTSAIQRTALSMPRAFASRATHTSKAMLITKKMIGIKIRYRNSQRTQRHPLHSQHHSAKNSQPRRTGQRLKKVMQTYSMLS